MPQPLTLRRSGSSGTTQQRQALLKEAEDMAFGRRQDEPTREHLVALVTELAHTQLQLIDTWQMFLEHTSPPVIKERKEWVH